MLLLFATPIVGLCNCSMFCCALPCVTFYFCNHLDGEERAGCFALLISLVSRDCFAALHRGSTGLSAVCDCGIS